MYLHLIQNKDVKTYTSRIRDLLSELRIQYLGAQSQSENVSPSRRNVKIFHEITTAMKDLSSTFQESLIKVPGLKKYRTELGRIFPCVQ